VEVTQFGFFRISKGVPPASDILDCSTSNEGRTKDRRIGLRPLFFSFSLVIVQIFDDQELATYYRRLDQNEAQLIE
jgi:hypothetical protein